MKTKNKRTFVIILLVAAVMVLVGMVAANAVCIWQYYHGTPLPDEIFVYNLAMALFLLLLLVVAKVCLRDRREELITENKDRNRKLS